MHVIRPKVWSYARLLSPKRAQPRPMSSLPPSSSPLRRRKASRAWDAYGTQSLPFEDFKLVHVCGGNGGDGSISMLSVYMVEFAGPDGGNGGNGGHVILRASQEVSSLSHLSSLLRGDHGGKGFGKNCDGKNASHTFVDVPIGTVIKNDEGETVAELTECNQLFLAAKGGAGGKGNAFFKSPTNTSPQIAEAGGQGEQFKLFIELKSIADVGLIGFPNAGKSTFLRSVSRARPKVAAYPFTTLRPHIGWVHFNDEEDLAIADLPGLIEDAHRNRGLGYAFLRHVQRCHCLAFIVDASDRSCVDQLRILRDELSAYDSNLMKDRPHLLLANKIDLDHSELHLKDLRQEAEAMSMPLMAISAKMGINIRNTLTRIRAMCDDNKAKIEAEKRDSLKDFALSYEEKLSEQ